MEDLQSLDKQFMIFCSFILNPDSIIKTMDQMRKSDDPSELERAERIYHIIRDYFEKSSKFTSDIEKIDMDNKKIQLATMVGNIFFDHDHPKFAVAFRKYNQIKKRYEKVTDNLFIKTEPNKPIVQSDLVFLNNLAAITADNQQEVSMLNLFNDRTFKSRIRDLYHSQSYYFEQAFCNIDILVQDKIIDILNSDEEKAMRMRDETRKQAFQFLEELYMISSIDKRLIRSEVKFTKDKAFESLKRILKSKDKFKTVSILLNDDTIMSAVFGYKYNNKDTLSTLKLLFIDALYPYNDLLLKRYIELMNRSEEGLKKDFETLESDYSFKRAYDRYQRIKDVEVLKKDSEILMLELEAGMVNDKIIGDMIQVIAAYEDYTDPMPEMLSAEEVHGFMKRLYVFINDQRLYHNKAITLAIESYLVKRLYNEFNVKSAVTRNTNQMDLLNQLTQYDMWYEVNRILGLFHDQAIQKVYLKFPDITYEFTPFDPVETSSRTLLRSDIQNFTGDTFGLDVSFERVKAIDLYLYREYYKLFKQIIMADSQVTISEEVVNKSLFKKNTVSKEAGLLYQEDVDRIQDIMATYATMVFLMNKSSDMFMDRFALVAPIMLRDLYTLRKSHKIITSHYTMTHNDYLLSLFALKRGDIEQMHKNIQTYADNHFAKGLRESYEKYSTLIEHIF